LQRFFCFCFFYRSEFQHAVLSRTGVNDGRRLRKLEVIRLRVTGTACSTLSTKCSIQYIQDSAAILAIHLEIQSTAQSTMPSSSRKSAGLDLQNEEHHSIDLDGGENAGEASLSFQLKHPTPLQHGEDASTRLLNSSPATLSKSAPPGLLVPKFEYLEQTADLDEGSFSAPIDPVISGYVAQVLEIIPDVDPEYALYLVSQHYPESQAQVVEPVLDVLLGNPNYRKVNTKGKRKRIDDGIQGDARGRPKAKLDYAGIDREDKGGAHDPELSATAKGKQKAPQHSQSEKEASPTHEDARVDADEPCTDFGIECGCCFSTYPFVSTCTLSFPAFNSMSRTKRYSARMATCSVRRAW
jgi:hypothetical protein